MISSIPYRTRLRVLQHKPQESMQLGCAICRHLNICGGISINYPAISCRDLCECNSTDACNAACPKRAHRFIQFLNEVDGFDMTSLPVAPLVRCATSPKYIPMVYSRSRRNDPLVTEAVAIPLSSIFSHDSGKCRFPDRLSLLRAYCINPNAKLVLSGVDEDRNIEAYWAKGRDAGIVSALATLQPDLVTTPNFSLFSNVPRHDNLINMKRIAIAWLEMTFAGIPAALHLNARTERDWERWTEFMIIQPSVKFIAFEFATGARIGNRGAWYIDRLKRMARSVGRPLHLVVRGTLGYRQLCRYFERVSIIDTTAYAKATRRFRAVRSSCKRLRWRRSWTLEHQPIDHILQHNVSECLAEFDTPPSNNDQLSHHG